MPQPANVQRILQDGGFNDSIAVTGDELGWTSIEVPFDGPANRLRIERYLTDADDLRDELDAWAAWVETQGSGPTCVELMQNLISTRQLFTLHLACAQANSELLSLVEPIAQWLASQTAGIYQMDGRGFFAVSRELLLKEE